MIHRREDEGSAMIEFIVLAVTLAVPLAYLVLAVFDIQRAAYGANSATRQAARVFVLAPSTAQAEQQARDAAQVALADQGLSVSNGSFTISCSASPCLTPGARVQVSFRTLVRLPLLPGFVAGDIASVPVSVSHTETVDVYAELRP